METETGTMFREWPASGKGRRELGTFIIALGCMPQELPYEAASAEQTQKPVFSFLPEPLKAAWRIAMNQKLENLLQLALQTPEEIREETEDLNVGFDSSSRNWELIVKYHGSLDVLAGIGVGVEYLIAGYAILTVPELLVEQMVELEQIEYVEKPKRYFYQQMPPTEGSCLEPVAFREPNLTGAGVLVAVLDSGIDYKLAEFRDNAGNTRIGYLWDQTLRPTEEYRPPEGFSVGIEFTAEEINAALAAEGPGPQFSLLPTVDTSGHGTAVAGIAVGSSARYRGVAVGAELLVVKLGVADSLGFPRTTEIMRAVTYAVRKAVELQMPLVVNLSFGNTYGAHDGSSLLERFLDNAAEIGRTVICVGSGNEGANGGHVAGSLIPSVGGGGSVGGAAGSADGGALAGGGGGTARGTGYLTAEIELAVAQYERSLNIQLWKNYSDVYRIYLRSPGGREAELPFGIEGGKFTLRLEQTDILVYLGEPLPYSTAQEIYLDLFPVGRPYINSGVWTIRLAPVEVVTGNYYLYLPSSAVRSEGTGFYRPTPEVTLTIPSTAAKVVTVGAYDSNFDAYADFSGRGYADTGRTIGVAMSGLAKPDLVAPGVNVLAPDIYGGYNPVTGTSFATPIVSGSAALLMEWGIVRGNDPFLYGEKVKAYLRKGARPLRGEADVPNDRVGWGALCVSDSLPG